MPQGVLTTPCVPLRASLERPRPHQARRQLRTRASASGSAGGQILREVLRPEERLKYDGTSDRDFYAFPRLVTHVDDGFLRQLTALYRQRIPPGSTVLDLCSSWVSHLPTDVKYAKVVGHGMNATELAKNPQLDSFFVRDLNADPGLQAPDATFDAVICCVSVQYLQFPEKILSECYRVLKPGGCVIFSFSNRMFYQKAIAAWRDGTGYSRTQLVRQYIQSVSGFVSVETVTSVQEKGKQDDSFFGRIQQFFSRASSDPFYAVIAYRNYKPVFEEK